jgi:RNA polymerase sigma-70 factor (ECF subfamily)
MQRIQDHSERFRKHETQLHFLLSDGLGGNARSYQLFLKLLSSHLRAYFKRRIYQLADDVEDLVQETLLAVHNKRHTYLVAQPVTAWVYAIARYKLIDWLRARASREAMHDPIDDQSELFCETDDEARQASKDLALMLVGLPDKQRLPIVFVKVEGLTVMETAQKLGMTESAVKIGIHRGLKTLAKKFRNAT